MLICSNTNLDADLKTFTLFLLNPIYFCSVVTEATTAHYFQCFRLYKTNRATFISALENISISSLWSRGKKFAKFLGKTGVASIKYMKLKTGFLKREFCFLFSHFLLWGIRKFTFDKVAYCNGILLEIVCILRN